LNFFLCTQEATKVAGHSIGVTAIIKLLGLTVIQMIGQLLFASNASSGLLLGDWQCSGGAKPHTSITPSAHEHKKKNTSTYNIKDNIPRAGHAPTRTYSPATFIL
jgi:hypothetical protein